MQDWFRSDNESAEEGDIEVVYCRTCMTIPGRSTRDHDWCVWIYEAGVYWWLYDLNFQLLYKLLKLFESSNDFLVSVYSISWLSCCLLPFSILVSPLSWPNYGQSCNLLLGTLLHSLHYYGISSSLGYNQSEVVGYPLGPSIYLPKFFSHQVLVIIRFHLRLENAISMSPLSFLLPRPKRPATKPSLPSARAQLHWSRPVLAGSHCLFRD